MKEIKISGDELVRSLLKLSESEKVFLLDSGNVKYLDSHLLVAGIRPLETLSLSHRKPEKSLKIFNEKLNNPSTASVFTISYEFGLKLEDIAYRRNDSAASNEPDIFLATFETLIIHNYKTSKTCLKGNPRNFSRISQVLIEFADESESPNKGSLRSKFSSNFTKQEYISGVEKIRELIRDGETYQTNLTQQFRVKLAEDLTSQHIFSELRGAHPAAFSAFITRDEDHVVSISPERFAKIAEGKITTSPIKGTRERGKDSESDALLKTDLVNSKKDRAENTMIVDLLRNDIGRICEFGSVEVEKLCDLEAHPTLFHLVSTVSGRLKSDVSPSDIIRAIFPCGSITGCPKIRTMEIIEKLENRPRGLSMGAIGYSDFDGELEMSVAIRTMVIRNCEAVFNVGGGIVIDSDPESEYEESLLKAKAILSALNCE